MTEGGVLAMTEGSNLAMIKMDGPRIDAPCVIASPTGAWRYPRRSALRRSEAVGYPHRLRGCSGEAASTRWAFGMSVGCRLLPGRGHRPAAGEAHLLELAGRGQVGLRQDHPGGPAAPSRHPARVRSL